MTLLYGKGYWGIGLVPSEFNAACLTFESVDVVQYLDPDSSVTVSYPATVNAGDLLIAYVQSKGGTSDDAGFTWLITHNHPTIAAWVGYKIADGTEGGGTETFSTSTTYSGFDIPLTAALARYSPGSAGIAYVTACSDQEFGAESDPYTGTTDWFDYQSQYFYPEASFIMFADKAPNAFADNLGAEEVDATPVFSPAGTTRDTASLSGDVASVSYPGRTLWNSFIVADDLDRDTLADGIDTEYTVSGFDPPQTGSSMHEIVVAVVCNQDTPTEAPVLTVDCIDSTENDLTWTDTDAGAYAIQYNSGFGWSGLASVPGNVNSYNDTGLSGAFRLYRIIGYNGFSSGGPPSNADGAGELYAPTLTVTSLDDTTLRIGIDWPDVGADDFILERYNGATWDVIATVDPTDFYDDTGLTTDVEYCYRGHFEGSGCFSDSDMSAEYCGTPVTNPCEYTPGDLINDDFADALDIPVVAGEFLFGNYDVPHTPTDGETLRGASKESGEPDHMGNAGGNSIWFKFVPDSSGPWDVEVDTQCESGAETPVLVGLYTGSDVASLTPVDMDIFDWDQGTFTDSCGEQAYTFGTATLVMGTTYYIAVDGTDGIEIQGVVVYGFPD